MRKPGLHEAHLVAKHECSGAAKRVCVNWLGSRTNLDANYCAACAPALRLRLTLLGHLKRLDMHIAKGLAPRASRRNSQHWVSVLKCRSWT